jgi:hypothetical protein
MFSALLPSTANVERAAEELLIVPMLRPIFDAAHGEDLTGELHGDGRPA